MRNAITDVPGVLVGQVQDVAALTGCTVLVFPHGAVGGVDVRGSASGTREMTTLSALHVAPQIHAITLAGGSAFGLDAAGGVMRDKAGSVVPAVGSVLYRGSATRLRCSWTTDLKVALAMADREQAGGDPPAPTWRYRVAETTRVLGLVHVQRESEVIVDIDTISPEKIQRVPDTGPRMA